MNFKKHILAFSAIACFIAISGCSGKNIDEDAFHAYQTAYESAKEINSSEYTIKLMVETENWKDGNVIGKFDISGTYNTKDNLPQMSATATLSINGIKMSDLLKLHLFENMMYIDMMGTKTKQPLQFEEEEEKTKQEITLSPDGIKEYLKECTSDLVDGKQIIHFIMTDDFLGNIVDLSQDSLKEDYPQVFDKDLIKGFKPLLINLTVDEDGGFSTYEFQATYEKDGQVMHINILIDLYNINNASEIVLPDFSEYIEKDTFEDELEDFANGGGKLPSGSIYDMIEGEDL